MEGSSVILGSILLLVLILVPGVAMTLALFPKWKEINFVERLGLAVLMGLLPQLLLYLLNKNFGVEITSMTSILAILIITAFGVVIYYQRK